ncbi:hypothetical protein PGB90_005705 [Kerria lacca]
MLEPASMTILTYPKQFSVERGPMNTTTSPLEDDSHRKITLNLSRNQDCSNNRGANHISFSVAALLADTRNSKTPSPIPEKPAVSSEDDIPDNDEDLDLESGEDDENIDVEVIKRETASPNNSRTPPNAFSSFLHNPTSSIMAARFMFGSQPITPVRPTPFTAIAAAAAAYTAGWPSVHGSYNPASSVFPPFTNALSNSPGKSLVGNFY